MLRRAKYSSPSALRPGIGQSAVRLRRPYHTGQHACFGAARCSIFRPVNNATHSNC